MHLVALRMSDEDLLAAGRGLVVAEDGSVSWREGHAPAGLTLERSTVSPTSPHATAEVQYRRGDERLTLRLQAGGDAVMDDLVRDRAASALEIGETTVAGVPAVLGVYDGGSRSSLMWQVRPGVVAELVGRRLVSSPDIGDAAKTIRELDEDAWQDLLDRFVDPPPDSAPLVDTANRTASAIRSMCELRAEWLAADEKQPEAVRLLRNLRRHAVEVGLERDTDVVAILDRLLGAMSAGDRPRVMSIPEGVGCG